MKSAKSAYNMPNSSGKKRKLFTLEEKKVIIQRLLGGERQVDLAKEYGLNKSSINTMWSTREKILGACETAAKGASRIPSKTQRHPVLDELEKLLLIWIEDMQMRGDPVSGEHICRKARNIYEELIKEYPDGEAVANEEEEDGHEEENKGFKASHGWLHRFQRRTGIKNVKMTGEGGSADQQEAAKFCHTLQDVIDEGLVLEDTEDPSVEELREMAAEKAEDAKQRELTKPQQVISDEKCSIKSAAIRDILGKWKEVQDFFIQHHPNKVEAHQAVDVVESVCGRYFHDLLKSKEKQTTIYRFFSPEKAGPSGVQAGPSGGQAGASGVKKRAIDDESDSD
ncbi:unnamed protein product [Notodromas monacha]|uniref:HTH CENPB-type domain-containing protein n=1 Tax=Notodromas monacha TaxID=399045 RepID=A0A7R9BNM0_9CRUS|nr:unnamed protein product [Notodromas monacha]CAG0917969.1 unnamed protein product [Notodromas monacha]